MSQPLISVIVPVYKVEKYLPRCIESLVHQSYANLEIILVDDGSPDNCPAVCDDYVKRDSRLQVIHKENGGLSDARNVGFDHSTGEYIAFIDSDDYVHPQMLEILCRLLIEENSEIAVCNFQPFSGTAPESPSEEIRTETLSGMDATMRLYQRKYATQAVVAWDKLYRRHIIEENRFVVGKFNEDEFFSYKALLKASRVTFTSQRLYYYLIRSTGISQAITNPKSLDGLDAKQEAIRFYDKNGFHSLLQLAVSSFLNFSAKRYCFVKRQNGNHRELLKEIKLRHKKILQEFSSSISPSERIRAMLFQLYPFLFWFFIKYDKIRYRKISK